MMKAPSAASARTAAVRAAAAALALASAVHAAAALAHRPAWVPVAGLPAGANPVADPASQVRCDAHTRFSFITGRLVRAEYAEHGVFEDRATLSVINRRAGAGAGAKLATVTVTVTNDTAWCNMTVAESGLVVSYHHNDSTTHSASLPPFSRHRLGAAQGAYAWRAGDAPRGNLGGTVATLSGVDGSLPLNCTGATKPGMPAPQGADFHCTRGVASTDGWAVVDDSFNAVIDPAADWVERSRNGQGAALHSSDLYIFVCVVKPRSVAPPRNGAAAVCA